ncbi:MAG: hypothetical protein GF329_04525 [Candidatus Lokiarchaeota archaeon]|nr:hypothetical protein [Candidatus Lokiarchaeota archaeon]
MKYLEILKQLIKENSYKSEDLPIYLGAVEELTATNENISDELLSINSLRVQIDIIGVIKGWIIINHNLKTGVGEIKEPDVILEMNEEVGQGMFIGTIDAPSAHKNEDLKIIGDISKAMQFRSLLTIISEELYFEIEY